MKVISAALLTMAALLLAACARTEFMPPDVQGAPLMAAVDGKPVADSAVFLRGRFLKQLPGEQALAATDPDGAFIWHSSSMDDEGRLSLTRVDAALKPLWTVELPLSETSTANPVRYWLIDNHVVVMGERSHEVEYATRREPFLVSVSLADGTMVAHNLRREATHPLDVSRVGPRIPGD